MPSASTTPLLRIALEWYLNPDHLPLLWAQRQARLDNRLAIELIAPDDHYDGFAALADGSVEAVVNEPLHLFERHAEGIELRSLGTFFHTDGGVLISRSAQEKLKKGGHIQVSSPVSNPVTDSLCRDILVGWAKKQQISVLPEQISVYEGGFNHVDNLKEGADAAWLAFANIEGVHVRELGLPVDMVTTSDGDVPGFSALELIASRQSNPTLDANLALLVSYLDAGVNALKSQPQEALELWCTASGTAADSLTSAMVNDTLKRFVAPVHPDASRWHPAWAYMREKGADVVDADTFAAIFKSEG